MVTSVCTRRDATNGCDAPTTDLLTYGLLQQHAAHRDLQRLRASHHENASLVVEVTGDIDASNTDLMFDLVDEHVSTGDSVVLDCIGVEFFAVSGLQALVDIDATCRWLRTPWTLISSGPIDRVLELAGHIHQPPDADQCTAPPPMAEV